MLSLHKLKSVKDALSYYQKGDYYTENAQSNSAWFGNGAERLGLQGSVDFEVFKGLLGGYLPNGVVMQNSEAGLYHQPGYDFTFSAPKSLSILALVADNTELLGIFRESVKEVLVKIEQKYAVCRNKHQGKVTLEKTANFIIAAFEHVDSREGDPNLHFHSVIQNMTQRSDGEWRTIYSKEFYKDKLLNGMELRSILAQKSLKAGYELIFNKNGTFEIAGVSEPLIKFFSKRRGQIEEWLTEHGLEGGKAAKLANFYTRAPKKELNPAQRKEYWIAALKEMGATLEELKAIAEQAKARGSITLPDPYLVAEQSVDLAVLHVSERQSLFSIPDLLKAAKLMSVLPANDADFLRAIEAKIQNKSLLYLEGNRLTTPETEALKGHNNTLMEQGQHQVNKMMASWIAGFFAHSKLNTKPEQEALKFLLTTEHRFVLLFSNATLQLYQTLKAFNELCATQPYYPRFLTQKATEVERLGKKINTERVGTIEGFLLACEKRAEKQNPNPGVLARWQQRLRVKEALDIWVVCNDISYSQVNRLQHWAAVFGARVIFTESQRQVIPALESLKAGGISHFNLIALPQYQQDLKTKEALLATLHHVEKEQAVQSIVDYQQRLQAAVKKSFLSAESALLVTLTNNERNTLNHLMREALIQQGVLVGNTLVMNTLQSLNLSQAEKRQPHLYQLNDVIRFNIDIPKTPSQKGRYFTVKNVNLTSGTLELEDKANNQILWRPPKDTRQLKEIEVFSVAARELRVGDTIIWTRTIRHESDKQFNCLKDQKALVIAVEKEHAIVRLKNGQTLTLSQKNIAQHWDYGYAVTLKNPLTFVEKNMTLTLSNQYLDKQAIQGLQMLLQRRMEEKLGCSVICDDWEQLKTKMTQKRIDELPLQNKEIPYERAHALIEHPSITTEPLFHRLQGEYLNLQPFNPEVLSSDASVIEAEKLDLSPESRLACDVVEKVCLYHAERKSVLNCRKMHLEAAQLGGLKTPIEKIESAFELAIERGWLIEVPQKSEDRFVTPKHTLLMEKLCLQAMKEGQNQLTPILSQDSSLLAEIKNTQKLTLGQKNAIELILTTPDRFTAVQGIAGAGKTTALKEVQRLCQTAGFQTLVLANTGGAKNQAKQKSGMVSLTTAQFLTRVEPLLLTDIERAKRDYGGNRLIILDEASMISTRDRWRLQQIVKALDVRSNGVGDFKQIGSIGAGDDFRDSLAYGINKALLTENVRLTEPNAFAVLKEAYQGNIAGTLNLLKDSIEEIPNKSEALEWIVNVYFLVEKISPEQPLVIMPLNEDRRLVNDMIRERLKQSERLTGDGITLTVLLPTDRRESDKKEALSYEPEDIIRFSTHHPRLRIKAGEYVKVVELDSKHERLSLQNDQGDIVYWSPKNLHKPSNIEIYREEKREFLANDVIVFKRNSEAAGIFNGDKATLLKIENNKAEVLLTDGNKVILDFNQKAHRHLDYGYALTPNVAQGKDVPATIGYGEVPKPYLKKSQELQIGDRVVLPKEDQIYDKSRYHEKAKIVEVLEIKNGQITFSSGTEQYVVKATEDRLWEYFPPFETRNAEELPLSTSQESFIVQISRGNRFFLAVQNKSDYQKTLEKHQQMNRSALSHFDPNWEARNKGVNRLLENISGIAEEKKEKVVKAPFSSPSLKEESTSEKVASKRQVAKSSHQRKAPFIDKEVLNRHLNGDVLGYATRWLGEPKKISGIEARWSGALTIQFKGTKAGWWKRWSAYREGGKDLISLYMNVHNVDYKTALKELAGICGMETSKVYPIKTKARHLSPTHEKNAQLEQQETQKKLELVRREYARGVSIFGTLAEKYLRGFRDIPGTLPADFRFKMIKHLDTKKLTPALITPIRDKDNIIIGLARVYLNRDGSKLTETYRTKNGRVEKATDKAILGKANNGAIVVQRGTISGTLWVAEGVETALSVAKAMPNHTVIASTSLDRFRIVPVSIDTQKVVICADNDGPNIPKAIIGAVEKHLSQGRRVFIAVPPQIPKGFEKYDFNDVLKREGIERVQAILESKVEVKNAELLKVEQSSLSMVLEKIRTTQQSARVLGMSSLQSEKVKIDLER